MKIEYFKLLRRSYSSENTLGHMLRNGEHYGWTMEDAVRASFMKVFGKTAIPAMTYRLVVRWSPKFKEERVFLESVPGFTGIQIHGANDENDVIGCIGCSRHISFSERLTWGSLKDDIVKIVKEASEAYIEIVNLPQGG